MERPSIGTIERIMSVADTFPFFPLGPEGGEAHYVRRRAAVVEGPSPDPPLALARPEGPLSPGPPCGARAPLPGPRFLFFVFPSVWQGPTTRAAHLTRDQKRSAHASMHEFIKDESVNESNRIPILYSKKSYNKSINKKCYNTILRSSYFSY